uniref:G-protein coupled receptors family 1 profile domain-containing protein n=1 Tax=Mola mola TaxID=94237 RepID=A0A3Q4BL69_MOLML
MEMNTTLSSIISTTIDEHTEQDKSLHTMSVVIYCLDFVLGVIGNGVVIWVTGFKMKKTVKTVWFLNLAVADFLFTAFLPLSVVYVAQGFHWPFGKFMCQLNSSLTSLNLFASVYILVAISVDRCVSVVWPVWAQNHRSIRKASCITLGVWVLALILSVPQFVFRDTITFDDKVVCYNNFALSYDYETQSVVELINFRHQAMSITRFIFGFLVPFTVIVSCYSVIIHRVRRNRSLAGQSGRAFKIIAAVITTFFLCWTPYHIFSLIEMVYHMTGRQSESLGFAISIGIPVTSSLAYLNSCLNPLLYVFMGQDFKDKVRKSILKALETAFQEDVTASHTESRSMNTIQSKESMEHCA